MELGFKDTYAGVEACMKNNLASIIHGSPAVGKSGVYKKLAEEHNLEFIDIRLTQFDPVDLSGLPVVTNGRADYALPNVFPLKGDKLPKGKKAFLLVFEEVQDCAPMVQGAAYRIILDRMINDVPLHEKCFIGATSNLITDGGLTRKMLPAMASRFIHYNMAPVLDEWLAWASKEGIDPMLLSAIEYNDEIFYNFNPEFVGSTYASPRSWEFASKLIAGKDKLNSKDLINLIGAVGDAAARQVLAYYEENNNIPSIKEILKNPERVEIPHETSKVYALGNRVASLVDKNNAKKMMKLVRKFDMEFQLSIMVKTIARDETLLSLPSIDKWHEKNSDLVTD